jgi:ketosteroid isomerase-like protein
MADLLDQLNRDIWHPFAAAYGGLDADAFMALNHPDVVHVDGTGGHITGYDEYAAQMRAFFAMVAERGDRIGIEFRFQERIAAGEHASERGLFRLSVAPADGDPRERYGRFHTIARRVDGRWRFAVDYDTAEDADADAFAAAAPVDDVERFASP